VHGLDDVAGKAAVLRAARGKAGRLVAAPDDDVGGGLDVLDAVAVGKVLVAGEVDDLGAGDLRLMRKGESMVITDRGVPIGRIVPMGQDLDQRLAMMRETGQALKHYVADAVA